MSSNNKREAKYRKSKKVLQNYYLIPIILVLAFIPLLVRSHTYTSNLSKYAWFFDGELTDFFLYWKSFVFILISVIISCIIIFRFNSDGKNIKFTPIFIPLGIYALFSLLSSIFSKYSYYSFHGIYEQHESILVLLGYCIITYYAFLFINNDEDIKKVFRCLNVSIFILCAIGISQAFNFDFYRTSLGKMSILPISQWNNLETIGFNFEIGRVYTSLYNPNYVGIYVGLLLPIILTLTLFSKHFKSIFVNIVIVFGLLICLFGSQSRSGILTLAFSLLFMAVLFRTRIIKQWKITLIGCLIIITAFFSINVMKHNYLLNRITGMFNPNNNEITLTDIQTNEDNVTIVYKNEPLIIRFFISEDKSYLFDLTDRSGNQVPYSISADNTNLALNDTRFPYFTFSAVNLPNSKIGFVVTVDSKEWYFTNQTDDGSYYLFNGNGKLDKNIIAKVTTLGIDQHFGSGRGYIWARTIPLLKNNILLGSGADTFSIIYPNNDYVGKYNFGYDNNIITKPHCMYLQIAVQTGIISLIAFLIFYIMYFISSIKLYAKCKFDSYSSQLGAAILAGTLGYMISGLTNDSTITVAPIFWCLTGIGLAINYNLKNA